MRTSLLPNNDTKNVDREQKFDLLHRNRSSPVPKEREPLSDNLPVATTLRPPPVDHDCCRRHSNKLKGRLARPQRLTKIYDLDERAANELARS